ncbi:exocyst complex component EXOC2/Sec5 [Artemisia annua]|uniref:Exocyst complex component SEC5 n=1 Tax=Artemisia annua TaxID=35608 RepID=A0A2U1MI29_ARTAN|nr:exocyst complex component EXOC2/Sec5 [Artemisia annua]
MSDSDEEDVSQHVSSSSSKSRSRKTKKAAKPVVNFMQKLGGGIPKRSHNKGAKAQHRREPSEDSEDSEVEMLSISSGDEDDSVDMKGGGKKEGGKDDDKVPPGGEPTKWKQVNEDELARRVREMRESKAAPTIPVPQKIERKQTTGAQVNNLQSLPRGMECIDPLGLGIISSRTMRLMTERSASSPSNNEVIDADFRDKLMFFSERFDPVLFISRIHQYTAAADLETGTAALKKDLKGWTQQRKQLVKENFDCFVSCKTTIDDIESKLKRIEEDPEGGSANLHTCIQGVNSMANRAFEPLLERQAQAEKIRAVQGTLQRFRTLFNLPSAIRGNIRKGEYDLAVREYRKAKSIVLPSHVGILKRVLEEVEKVMHDFKGMLYQSMEDPNIDLTNLENVVRLLLELEPESDPVRRYFSIQVDISLLHVHHGDSGSEELDALRGRYIRRLTAVLIHHIPPFWKVALSVSTGKFAKGLAEQNKNTSTNKTVEKLDGRYSNHSVEVVSGMIHDTISAYVSEVQNTFHDLDESNVLCPYMSDAIMDISKACQAFESKEAAPTNTVEALRTLLFESTKIYIVRICSWMRVSIEEISRNESWVPVTVLERNKSQYAISSLPLDFRYVMESAMDQIDMMIKSLRNEATSEDTLVLLHEAQESVRLSFFNCLLGFAGNMEQIGSELGENISNKDYYDYVEENLSYHRPGCISDPHQQLLMVLSNIGFCKDDLSREMYNKYKHVWLKSRGGEEDDDKDRGELEAAFTALEEKVLDQYTYAKAHYIRTAATNYLLDAGLHWGGAPAVKVFAGCEPLLDKTLGILVEGLMDTLLSLFYEHKESNLKLLDANGYCQLMLELEYFETILNQYFTSEASEALKSLQGILLEKATESATEASDAAGDDRQQGSITPDDLIALAQQCSSELLQSELERTRINTACFMESFPLEFAPESVKVAYASFRGSMDASSGVFMGAQAAMGSTQRWR